MQPVPGTPRWAVVAAWLTVVCVLPSGVWRTLVGFGVPLGWSQTHLDAEHIPGFGTAYVLFLTVASTAAAALTLGLVYPSPRPWRSSAAGAGVSVAVVPRLLAPADLAAQLASLPGWEVEDDRLVRTVQLADFVAAIDLVVRVADEAEAMNHHPDVDVRYDRVRFGLWTHVAGGITQYDVELAHRISALL